MTTDTERFVFDAYHDAAVRLLSNEPRKGQIVVVSDDAICNDVAGASMPNPGDHVTIAGPAGVFRGKVSVLGYIVELEA